MSGLLILFLVIYVILPSKYSLYKAFFKERDDE